jgi:hypothetical protein
MQGRLIKWHAFHRYNKEIQLFILNLNVSLIILMLNMKRVSFSLAENLFGVEVDQSLFKP